jgi:hypothetical protein
LRKYGSLPTFYLYAFISWRLGTVITFLSCTYYKNIIKMYVQSTKKYSNNTKPKNIGIPRELALFWIDYRYQRNSVPDKNIL